MRFLIRIALPLVLLVTVSSRSLAQGAGDAMQFGGSDYVDIGTWGPGNEWTLEAWVMPASLSNGTIVGSRAGECSNWALAIQDGQFVVIFSSGTDPKTCLALLSSGVTPAVGAWHHIIAVNDGLSMKIYVNGELRGSVSLPAAYTASTAGARIGDGFNGAIEEVRIWNTARTVDQIRCSMHLNPSPAAYVNGTTVTNGIVAHYDFNGLSFPASTIPDVSGNDHDGTNNGGQLMLSTAPVGEGTCESEEIDEAGVTDFEDTHIVIEMEVDGSLTSPFVVVINEMFASPEGTSPPGTGSGKYWIIHNYGGDAAFTANITYGLGDAFPSALGGAPAAAQLYTRASTGDGSWTFRGDAASVDANLKTVTFNGLTSFSQHTITFTDSRLPVELTGFTARVDNNEVVLDWRTASEVDNAGFEVQRAHQGDGPSAFMAVGSYLTTPALAGLGTSSEGRNYRYADPRTELVPGETYLYRLVDVSTDGVRREHPPISVTLDNGMNPTVPLFFQVHPVVPNPAHDEIVVSFDMPEAGKVTIEVYGADGKRMTIPIADREYGGGRQSELISVAGFPSGTYTLTISSGSRRRTQKFAIVR